MLPTSKRPKMPVWSIEMAAVNGKNRSKFLQKVTIIPFSCHLWPSHEFLLSFWLKMIWWKFRENRTLGSVKTKLSSLNLISWNVKVWRRKWSTVPRRFRAEISTWERILEIILRYIWNTIINDQLYFVNTRYKFDRLYQTHRLRSKIAGVTLGENDSKIFE